MGRSMTHQCFPVCTRSTRKGQTSALDSSRWPQAAPPQRRETVSPIDMVDIAQFVESGLDNLLVIVFGTSQESLPCTE